jgi:hypothetical protein
MRLIIYCGCNGISLFSFVKSTAGAGSKKSRSCIIAAEAG